MFSSWVHVAPFPAFPPGTLQNQQLMDLLKSRAIKGGCYMCGLQFNIAVIYPINSLTASFPQAVHSGLRIQAPENRGEGR